MKPFSTVIVGAGRIGASFDSPSSAEVLTHAHAFSRHDGFRLVGFVDTDRALAERAAHDWGGTAFSSLADAGAADVVVIAVPDEHHYAALCEAAKLRPRIVLCEKPLTTTLEEASAAVALYRDAKIPLAVNFSRRYLPDYAAIRSRISAGDYGRFLRGHGYYGNGTLHNGSHLVDLLDFFLGTVTPTATLDALTDRQPRDPTCSAALAVGEGTFIMQAVDSRCFTVFELDLLFERGRLRFTESGYAVDSFEIIDSPLFSGYRVLSPSHSKKIPLSDAMVGAVSAIHAHLRDGAPLPCTGDDALRSMHACASIIAGIS